jgi:hypothetical protein
MMTEEEKKESKKISAKKWRDNNKEYIKEKTSDYKKKYYFKNKEYKVKVLLSEEEKRESKKISAKKWRNVNKDYYIEYKKQNIDEISEYQRQYQLNNKDVLNKKNVLRKKLRYTNNINYRLKTNIRNLIVKAFKRNGFSKVSKTLDILGCTFGEFKLHLENKFEEWMSWDNKGRYNGDFNYGWDIDHIIPISFAKTEEELIKLNHYTNLQPLCSKINRDIKKDKIYYEMD